MLGYIIYKYSIYVCPLPHPDLFSYGTVTEMFSVNGR